jgi:hypothetical protein
VRMPVSTAYAITLDRTERVPLSRLTSSGTASRCDGALARRFGLIARGTLGGESVAAIGNRACFEATTPQPNTTTTPSLGRDPQGTRITSGAEAAHAVAQNRTAPSLRFRIVTAARKSAKA